MIADMLKPYQRVAAERIVNAGCMLLSDQPGLGKTFTSLGALELSGVLVPGSVSIVIAPLITCDTAWLPTAQSFMPEVNVIDGFSGSRLRRSQRIAKSIRDDVANLIVTNHDSLGISKSGVSLVPAIIVQNFVAIIIDESHMVLPMTYDFMSEATQFWRGLNTINNDSVEFRVAVSGTPDRGKFHYRLGTWRFLMPLVYSAPSVLYSTWLSDHFYTYEIKVPVRKRDGSSFDTSVTKVGHMLDKPRWASMDRLKMIRRTKSEVAQELPPKQYVDIDLPFSDKLSRSYTAFINEFILDDDGSVKNALVYSLRAAQFATCEWAEGPNGKVLPVVGGESPKRDWIFEWLRERNLLADPDDTPNGKVVIASQYTRVLFWLKEELAREGVYAEVLSGDISQHERSRIQRLFQDESSGLRIVLLSAGLGVGIDLDVADDLILVDIPRNPDIQEQVEDRIHRVSRMHNVTIWRLRSRSTIDVTISAKNDEVFRESRAMMDGVRAVDFDRKIMDRIGVS